MKQALCARPARIVNNANEVNKLDGTIDTELMEWLNDHATLLGVIKDDGETEYIKVEGNDLCFRDLVDQISGMPVCKHCGCTDLNACPRRCSWTILNGKESVCSRCAGKK